MRLWKREARTRGRKPSKNERGDAIPRCLQKLYSSHHCRRHRLRPSWRRKDIRATVLGIKKKSSFKTEEVLVSRAPPARPTHCSPEISNLWPRPPPARELRSGERNLSSCTYEKRPLMSRLKKWAVLVSWCKKLRPTRMKNLELERNRKWSRQRMHISPMVRKCSISNSRIRNKKTKTRTK